MKLTSADSYPTGDEENLLNGTKQNMAEAQAIDNSAELRNGGNDSNGNHSEKNQTENDDVGEKADRDVEMTEEPHNEDETRSAERDAAVVENGQRLPEDMDIAQADESVNEAISTDVADENKDEPEAMDVDNDVDSADNPEQLESSDQPKQAETNSEVSRLDNTEQSESSHNPVPSAGSDKVEQVGISVKLEQSGNSVSPTPVQNSDNSEEEEFSGKSEQIANSDKPEHEQMMGELEQSVRSESPVSVVSSDTPERITSSDTSELVQRSDTPDKSEILDDTEQMIQLKKSDGMDIEDSSESAEATADTNKEDCATKSGLKIDEKASESAKSTDEEETSTITMAAHAQFLTPKSKSDQVEAETVTDDLAKLKNDGGLKMQLDDGETFEVQIVSSSDEDDDEDDDDVEETAAEPTNRVALAPAAPGSAASPVVIDQSPKAVSVVPRTATITTSSVDFTASVTKITIPSTGVQIRTATPSHKPSILTPTQVFRDSKGNYIRKPIPVLKSSSVSQLQPALIAVQAATTIAASSNVIMKPSGPTNEELAIEFNKKSRKKLTINNLIDALKEFGVDLEYLKQAEDSNKTETVVIDLDKNDSDEQKKKKKSNESSKKVEESEKAANTEETTKSHDQVGKSEDTEKKSALSDDEAKDAAEKKVDVKSDESEKSTAEKADEAKSDSPTEKKAEEMEIEPENAESESKEPKKDEDKEKNNEKVDTPVVKMDVKENEDVVEESIEPTRRSSRLSSRTADKAERESVDRSARKTSEKEKVADQQEAAKKDGTKKEGTKTSSEGEKAKAKSKSNKEEVVIESDDEKENKKGGEDQDADIASHGDVAKKLRPVAKFLYFTGLDFCREVVYDDLVTAFDKKHKVGKLYGPEIHDLQQMKKLFYNLRERNRRLRPRHGRVCKRCPYSTESKSVMYLHKQQGHLDERSLKWSCAMCDFETRMVQQFTFHVEAEHGMTAYPLPKPLFFMCSLCPYNSSTKSHLSKHMIKCEKQFVAEKHQFPLYDDINFIFRALPGPLIKVPPAPPQPVPPQPMVRPQLRPVTVSTPQRFVLAPGTAVPILPRGVQYRHLPPMRPAPIVAPGRNRYPPQTAQQFITNTIQQMKIQPQSQPIVIKDVTPSAPVVSTAPTVVRAPVSISRPPTIANLSGAPAPKPKTGKYSYEVCEICGGFVLDRQALRLHFAMAHNINLREDALDVSRSPPLACDFCTSRFFTFQGLSLHKARSNHARADQALCHICNTLTSDMPAHIKTAHNIVPNQLNTIRICPICGQCVLTEKTEAHIERVHNIKLDKPVTMTAKPVYGCSQCSAQFTERSLLNLHIRKGHPPPANKKCTICGALTRTSGYNGHVLVAHCRKKLKIKLTRCDEMPKGAVFRRKRIGASHGTPMKKIKIDDEQTENVVVLDSPEKSDDSCASDSAKDKPQTPETEIPVD